MSTQFICDVCGATNSRSETYGPEHPYRYLHQIDVGNPHAPVVHLTVTPKVESGEDVCGACVLRAIEGLIKCMANPLPKDAVELEEQLTGLAKLRGSMASLNAEADDIARGRQELDDTARNIRLLGLADVQNDIASTTGHSYLPMSEAVNPMRVSHRPDMSDSYLTVGGEYAAPDSPGREGPDPDVQPVPPPLEGTGTRSDGVPRPYPQNPEHYHFYSIHPDGKEWCHWHDHACPIEGCYYYECAPKDKGDVYHLTRYLTPAER